MALGQRFEAVVPREPVRGAAALLPWIAAAAGLVVAALVMALSLGSARRRADLTASRARIVTSTDEARRRIERDLHDGIQQRLVTLGLELQGVKEAVPAEPRSVPAQIAHVEDGMRRVLDELREISRGVHPAILSEGGLGPALRSLARRAPVPVELDVGNVERLPQQVEVAAYYAVSEALANAGKHANASVVQVNLKMHGRTLHLSIRDDGAGGADPARGSGIVGLTDRVEALGGRLAVTSPPGGGTEITVDLPAAPGRAALQPD
jgi:signal transduction histidine kinase